MIYEAEDDANLKKNIINVKITWPFYFSAKVKSLIQSCLDYDPGKRIKIESIQEHPWFIKYKDLL